ncbi:MAG TPA: CarD family transcriptional regulator [Pseudogracilibacillus sp.]|nr:CarD family transcriptional regulator [Pseudogracilibacillus sp.]
MFNIGDLVVYSTHGVCQIDDIYEQTIIGKTREYYKLHPVENDQHLTINAPVHGTGISIMELMDKQEAKDVLQVFSHPTKEDVNIQPATYTKLVDDGDRKEIASIINTLLRKQAEAEEDNKKLNGRDRDLLRTARSALFTELSISLDTSVEKINNKILTMVETEQVS